MSPGVLLDSGAARIHRSTTQVSRSLSSFHLSNAVADMNSSNIGDLNPGFPNSAHNAQQNLSFNSRSLSGSSVNKGLSRPRLVKVRKQSNVQNFKPGGESRIEPGFNPFQPEAGQAGPWVSSSTLDLEKGFGNLKIGTGNDFLNSNSNAGDGGGFVFGSDLSKNSGSNSNIDDNMKKLNINDSDRAVDGRPKLSSDSKAKFGFANVDASSVGKTMEELALPEESKTKINAGKSEGSYGGTGVFRTDNVKNVEVKGSEKGRNVVGEVTRSALRDRVKNLKLKKFVNAGPVDDKINLKDGFTFGIKGSTNRFVGGDREKISSSDMGCKSDVRDAMRELHGEIGMAFSSSETFDKDFQTANGGDKKSPEYDTVRERFGSKGVEPGKHATGIQVPTGRPEDVTQTNSVPGPSFVFSSSGLAGGKAFGMQPSSRPEKMDEFSFTSKKDDVGSPFVGLKPPSLKGNIFSGSNQKVEFGAKLKDLKGKKKRGKLKQPTKVHLWPGQDFVSGGTGPHEVTEASESYSPMDVSPYQETFSDTQISRETSVASEESFSQDNQCALIDSQTVALDDAIDEDLVAAAEQMGIKDPKCREVPQKSSDHCFGANIGTEKTIGRRTSGAETESFKSANEDTDSINDFTITSGDNEVSSSSKIQRQGSDIRIQFFSAASSDDIGGSGPSGFQFAASSTAKSSGSHHQKKKNWSNVGRHSFSSCPNAKDQYASSAVQFSQFSPASLPSSPTGVKKAGLSTAFVVGDNTDVLRAQDIKQQSDLAAATSIAAQEACEKWRLRGNQAYTSGDLSKAEDCYTKGINCVSKSETSRSCLRALMLCYSNRAATLMSLGRLTDALGDCKMAAAIDPTFLRVQVRAANCYLALGEVEDASEYFKKCMHLRTDAVDRKIAVDASEGLQKAQKVSEYMQHCSELLQKRTSNDAELALEVIAEALLISSYSEKLLEMKAESLFLLRKYEDVVKLCEQTFDSAKKNSFPLEMDYCEENLNGSKLGKENSFRQWRTRLIFKSYFYLGKLEEAVGSLEKQQELDSVTKSFSVSSETLESLIPLAATVGELLHHKTAGNEAFQAGRHSDAIEHYTAALSRNIESRPFAAICFCNRAAAYKALGQVIDAIADCSLAIALDGNYLKAMSRRASLYEMIRDYGQASNDLQRLVAILMKRVEEKTNQHAPPDRSSNMTNDLRQARLRLSTIEEESRKEIPLNMYLILGIEPSASASEIRKAYRKAALRHHPDKAGQSLTRSDNGDDGLWKEIGEEVHKDADRLFKMIGEAYAVLSDPTKRSQYDQDEEMRKKRNGNSTYRSHTDTWNHPFESSSTRRQWREVWRSHGR